jgi:hypothetical protein
MFNEFANQIWTPSDPSITVSNNTDLSIDGSSRRIDWVDAINENVSIAFTAVDLTAWEEITLHAFLRDQLTTADLFRITINSVDYDFNREDLQHTHKWNQIIFDCSGMGTISSIVITALVPNLVLFIDYLGYRRATYNSDVDIITALKNHIVLDYGVSTTLSSAVAAGASSISLVSSSYVNDTSILELDNGAGVIEEVELLNRDGSLVNPTTNAYPSGSEVRAICPVKAEDFDSVEPDPVCGIKIYDATSIRDTTILKTKNGTKIKEYLGTLGIIIYIDCSNKKKLLQMVREFNFKYGEAFQFLLDGERVDIYQESTVFADDMIGNNPRMAYYYRIEPQPYLLVNVGWIDTLTITPESISAETAGLSGATTVTA